MLALSMRAAAGATFLSGQMGSAVCLGCWVKHSHLFCKTGGRDSLEGVGQCRPMLLPKRREEKGNFLPHSVQESLP